MVKGRQSCTAVSVQSFTLELEKEKLLAFAIAIKQQLAPNFGIWKAPANIAFSTNNPVPSTQETL